MRYPALFTPNERGGFVVTFRDIPEAITEGETEADALEMAADALLTAMDFYFEDARAVPVPSKAMEGERLVVLPLSVSAKVMLLNEMVAQRVRPVELARRMGVSRQEVNRIMNLSHATKIDTVAAATAALGKELALILS